MTARVGIDHAPDVDPTHTRNLPRVVIVERAAPGHARVVHEDGDGTQFFFCPCDHRCDRTGVGNIRGRGNRAPAGASDFRDQFVRCIGVRGIVHADGDAVLRQAPRGGSPDTAGAAGHQRHLIAPRHGYCPRSALGRQSVLARDGRNKSGHDAGSGDRGKRI